MQEAGYDTVLWYKEQFENYMYHVNEFKMFSEFRNSGAIATSSHQLPTFGTLCKMAAMYLAKKQGATPHRQTHTQTP